MPGTTTSGFFPTEFWGGDPVLKELFEDVIEECLSGEDFEDLENWALESFLFESDRCSLDFWEGAPVFGEFCKDEFEVARSGDELIDLETWLLESFFDE